MTSVLKILFMNKLFISKNDNLTTLYITQVTEFNDLSTIYKFNHIIEKISYNPNILIDLNSDLLNSLIINSSTIYNNKYFSIKIEDNQIIIIFDSVKYKFEIPNNKYILFYYDKKFYISKNV